MIQDKQASNAEDQTENDTSNLDRKNDIGTLGVEVWMFVFHVKVSLGSLGSLGWKVAMEVHPIKSTKKIMDVMAIESDELVEVDPSIYRDLYPKVWEFTLQHNWL